MHYDVEIIVGDGELKHLGCVQADSLPREGDSMTLAGSALSSDPGETVSVIVKAVDWFVKFSGTEAAGTTATVVVCLSEFENPPPTIYCVCSPIERITDANYSDICAGCGDVLRKPNSKAACESRN